MERVLMGVVPRPAIVRALNRLGERPTDGSCWLWPGSTHAAGYGQIEETPDRGRRRAVLVHRLVFEHFVGPIEDGLVLDHLCRVRLCCNPDHLEPVTNRENILRGDSACANKARQLTCLRGHEFGYVDAQGKRVCRVCRSMRKRGEIAGRTWNGGAA